MITGVLPEPGKEGLIKSCTLGRKTVEGKLLVCNSHLYVLMWKAEKQRLVF